MGLRAAVPTFAQRVARPLSLGATVLMLVAFVPVVVVAWPKIMAQVGNLTVVAIVLLTLVGLLIGHALGGPDPGDRTVLALSTATRHPGVAVAVARAGAPDDPTVVATVFLAFLVGMLVTVPYVRWRRRVAAEATP
jgi:BASS family bile acid:Na+ symporter